MKSNLTERSRDMLTNAIAELGRSPKLKGSSACGKDTGERVKIYLDYERVRDRTVTTFCASTIQCYRHECHDIDLDHSVKQAITHFWARYTFERPTTLYLHNKKLFQYAVTRRLCHLNLEVELMPKEELEGHLHAIIKKTTAGIKKYLAEAEISLTAVNKNLAEVDRHLAKVKDYDLIPG